MSARGYALHRVRPQLSFISVRMSETPQYGKGRVLAPSDVQHASKHLLHCYSCVGEFETLW